jgi:aminoglycoside phosphotransferase (APT) family kinase protein
MTTPSGFPTEVDDLRAQWFSHALQREITQATILESSTGTTGRARVALVGEPDVPASVFVKLPPFGEQQRALVDHTGMGVTEARFYRDLAAEIPVRVPAVWFSATEGRGYIMVLEDLVAGGCRFPTPDDPDIERRARDIVEQLATLHAHFWDSARFALGGDLEWLAQRGARSGGGGRTFIEQAVAVLGDQMDDEFHRIAELYLAHTDAVVALWRAGPGTLVHGDSHLGNLFVDTAAGDRTGFLDWAVVCQAPGIRDLAYTMCNSVPPDIREAIERNIVDRYCELLGEQGVEVDADDTWNEYRVHAVYSWVAAAATAGVGSKWQPIEIGLAGTRRATAACAHLDSAGLLESMLA